MNQADEAAAPMEALNDAQLSSQPRDLITLWRELPIWFEWKKSHKTICNTREKCKPANQIKIL
jgi:hypothetical protein